MSNNNPYLNGRQEWLERYGDYIAAARNWRLMAILSGAVAALAVGGLVVLSSQQKIVPYVVAVDEIGREVAIGRADVAAAADERVIRSVLARWVMHCRTVYQDDGAQRGLVDQAYQYIDQRSEAYQQLNGWFRANNPFEREAVQPRILSVLRVSDTSWRAEWEETRGDGEGGVVEAYQATITVAIAPPVSERQAMVNPLGIYITYFQWGLRL